MSEELDPEEQIFRMLRGIQKRPPLCVECDRKGKKSKTNTEYAVMVTKCKEDHYTIHTLGYHRGQLTYSSKAIEKEDLDEFIKTTE